MEYNIICGNDFIVGAVLTANSYVFLLKEPEDKSSPTEIKATLVA